MNNELLLLFKKQTDTPIKQTNTKPQGTLEFKLNKQMQTFCFKRVIKLCEERKWFLAVTILEATNSLLIIADENNKFSLTTPGQWYSEESGESFDNLFNLLELRSENYIELLGKEVEKRETWKEIENTG